MTGPNAPVETTRVQCWCGRGYVEIPVREVRDGLTGPCVNAGCRDEDRRRRRARSERP